MKISFMRRYKQILKDLQNVNSSTYKEVLEEIASGYSEDDNIEDYIIRENNTYNLCVELLEDISFKELRLLFYFSRLTSIQKRNLLIILRDFNIAQVDFDKALEKYRKIIL